MVYTVAADNVSTLLEADPIDLGNDTLIPLYFENLSEAEFALNGQSYSFARTETEAAIEAEDETEEVTTTEISVTLNGENIDKLIRNLRQLS